MTVDYGKCARRLLRRCVILFLVSVQFIQSKDVTMVIGEVGGAVTLPCTSDIQRLPNHLYVQRPDPNKFINGYHKTRDLPSPHPEYANRTQVDHTQGTMRLWSIRLSDEGLYECHIGYPTKNNQKNIQLSVTANYSTPNVTVACDNGSCLVTCSSDNGYPRRDVEWSLNPPLNQSHWGVVNSSGGTDPVSMLFSVFSSISINCSSGPRLNLSCAVGGTLSQEHIVCRHPDISVVSVISAVSVIAAVLLCFLVLVTSSKKKKAQTARGNQGGKGAASSEENVQLT
ncbi:T-lymphocyte activation antigen CD80 isoform X2 [Oncorhynchus keta]|uniref:T-lymphocyte activation antigen CD80 isoform X2 n=1 Tax=Oncorhynchus keta TaxID=8018 RepID=UPI0015F82939|nr:T-lymphocyte activation antigen CD80 isoform X2 [Oncorhynchus keta]XP_052360324.1 T-lymphocyte activation antigen CD80 isoform X2 [Oncorhynchus keta]